MNRKEFTGRLQSLLTSDLWNVVVLAVVTALLFAPAIFRDDFRDLLYHTTAALDPDITRAASTGYPLFHMTVRALVMLCSIPPFAAGVLVATIAKLALAVSVYLLLRRPPHHITPAGPNSAFVLSLVLCLLGPINLFTLPHVYLGYLAPNVVHNPTIIMMVPFALWESVMLGYLLVSPRPSGRQLSLAAVLVVLSSLAKPSFNLAAIPAFCLVLLLQLVAKERSFWSALRAGSVIVVPVVALSLMQFWLLFGRWSGGASTTPSEVLVAPFTVLKVQSGGSLSLAIFKICASLGIPIVGLFLFRKSQHVPKASRTILLFCALTLVAALSQAVLFVEQSEGRSISDGNFLWGASSALFIASFAVVLTLFDLKLRPSQWFAQIGRPYRPMLLVLGFSVLGGLLVMRPLLPSNTLVMQVRTMLFGH